MANQHKINIEIDNSYGDAFTIVNALRQYALQLKNASMEAEAKKTARLAEEIEAQINDFYGWEHSANGAAIKLGVIDAG